MVLQGFSKIEFMCFLKKQKHEKISRGVFTNIPAVHSIVSIIRHVHVLFYNNREIAAVDLFWQYSIRLKKIRFGVRINEILNG